MRKRPDYGDATPALLRVLRLGLVMTYHGANKI